MSRFSSSCAVLFGATALIASAGTAHATCPIETATYQGGAFGAYAVTTTGCFTDIDEDGGTGFTTAMASSTGLSSSADLGLGVLTVEFGGRLRVVIDMGHLQLYGTASRRSNDHGDP